MGRVEIQVQTVMIIGTFVTIYKCVAQEISLADVVWKPIYNKKNLNVNHGKLISKHSPTFRRDHSNLHIIKMQNLRYVCIQKKKLTQPEHQNAFVSYAAFEENKRIKKKARKTLYYLMRLERSFVSFFYSVLAQDSMSGIDCTEKYANPCLYSTNICNQIQQQEVFKWV